MRSSPPPNVPNSLVQTKDRWLQGIVRNATNFQILFVGSYRDSCRFEKFPDTFAEPFNLDTFVGCEGDNTIGTGFTRGLTYKIDIDEKNFFYFSIVRTMT